MRLRVLLAVVCAGLGLFAALVLMAGLRLGAGGTPVGVVLWGGVPGAIFSRAFPQKRFVALVEEALAAWSGEWFILGTADQVPPDGDIERCRIVSELVARAQGYEV